MTTLEITFIIISWIILGFFICMKAKWYKQERDDYRTDNFLCFLTILLSPLVFAFDIINRMFIKSWH